MSYRKDVDKMKALLSWALLGDGESCDGTIWEANSLEETSDGWIKIWVGNNQPAEIDLNELAEVLIHQGVQV